MFALNVLEMLNNKIKRLKVQKNVSLEILQKSLNETPTNHLIVPFDSSFL